MLARMMAAGSRAMPRTTARAGAWLMLRPGRRMRERPEQREVMARAGRDTLEVGRHRMAVYRWGSGSRRVLLVHGWNGRAAQFAAVVERLEPDATLVAFDAPGHGASAGSTADLGMWIEAIRALDGAEGGFDLIVGHSFGGLAAQRARRAGLVRARVVSVSAPPSTDAVTRAYGATVGLSDAVVADVSAALERRLGPVLAAIAVDSPAGAPSPYAQREAGDILVVHDRGDRVVPFAASGAIEAAWVGPVESLRTDGRGHNGILIAPEVLDAIEAFALRDAAAVAGAA